MLTMRLLCANSWPEPPRMRPDRQRLTAEMRAADTKWLRIAFWVRSPATYSPDAVDPWAAGSDGSQLTRLMPMMRDSWSQIANG